MEQTDPFRPKHIFQFRVERQWYSAPDVIEEERFDQLMDLLEWRLPYNISVFHFHQAGAVEPIVSHRPRLDIPVEALFASRPRHAFLRFRDRSEPLEVEHLSGRYAIIASEDGYGQFADISGTGNKLIVDMELCPLSFRVASAFVARYHRHNAAPPGHKFSIGLQAGGELVGVLIASRPKARALDDGLTLEINRCCVSDLYLNACSKLLGAAVRAGRSMGYQRFVSYTLPEESGSSLLAVGFQRDGVVPATSEGWDRPSRRRVCEEKQPLGRKTRWLLKKKISSYMRSEG